MYLAFQYRGTPRWTPEVADDLPQDLAAREASAKTPVDARPLAAVWLRFGLARAVVLVGGWLAAGTAEVLAEET